MDDVDETYIMLLLSDSNLPTGSFVASSGLESYFKHGFGTGSGQNRTVEFIQDSLGSYARSALPFVSDSHTLVTEYLKSHNGVPEALERVLQRLHEMDELYHCLTLNLPARRASQAQGVALLTLYSKGFSAPPGPVLSSTPSTNPAQLIDRYKTRIRAETSFGHLPLCWGILTGCMGLSLERSQYLHLFLHARGLLSASIRLNEIGPYNAQQILLHTVRPLVSVELARCKHIRTLGKPEDGFFEPRDGPATTWPLGEMLAARHDLQHSRIFNS